MATNVAQPSQSAKTTSPEVPADSTLRPGMAQPAGRPGRRRGRAIDPSSAQALALLTRHPISAAPIPRVHIGPRGTDGSIVVDDRASDRKFVIYTPRRDSQFRAGYRAGLWYVRVAGDHEPSPRSPGFPTAVAAIETIRSPRNVPIRAASSRPHPRVIWS